MNRRQAVAGPAAGRARAARAPARIAQRPGII
jgi:hypothetical protein